MAQIFEVTWSEGTVTPELISSLLRQYVTQGGLYGTVVVKEAAQQSVQSTKAIRCACGGEMLANYRCQNCGLASPL